MTDSAQLSPSASNGIDVRSLDQKLRSAFRAESKQTKSRQEGFQELQRGFEQGRFGGCPIKGDALPAMLSILDKLGWTISVDQITRCMPHFPLHFGVPEMRECLARMGYESHQRIFKRNQISGADLPALLIDGDRLSILEGDKTIIARDPMTGDQRTDAPKAGAMLVTFRPATAANEKTSTGSWLRRNLIRFTPEIYELLGLTFVINLMVLAVSFSVMTIYDKVIPAEAIDTLLAIGIGITLAMGIELFFRYQKARLIGRTSGRLEYLLGTAIFSKLISLPIQMVANTPVGDQVARLRQFETVRDIFSGPFVAVVIELPFVVLFTIGLFILAGPLGFVPLVMVVLFILLSGFLIGPIKRQNEYANRRRREHYQTALETVSNLRQLRSIGCEDVWLARLRQKTAESAASKRRANLLQRILATVSASTVPIAGGATVALGAILVMEGQLSVGMLIGAMIVIWRVLAPIQQMLLMLTRYTEMAQMVKQIDHLMNMPSAAIEPETPVRRMFSGEVSFDRVSFRYQGAPEAAIQGLTFKIPPGALVAIEGHSGSGKSTLLRLILDLYQPQVGSIQVDGVNVRQIPKTDLRATIGYVPQKPVLFHGTIAQNLRLASPGAPDDQLRKVCAEVGLLESIDELPEGINTLLDHARNENLPGGFRQALSIAQALLRNPRILLMDEPAKTLDHALEDALLNSIKARHGNTTILMTSHRPSHIRLADRVLKLDRGQLMSFDPPAPVQPQGARP